MLLVRVASLWCLCAVAAAQFGGFDLMSFLFGDDLLSLPSASTGLNSPCGSYNRSTNICCGRKLRAGFGEDVTECCRSVAIDLRVNVCCNGAIAPKIPDDSNGVDHTGCCGSRSYDRRNATCCGHDRLSTVVSEEYGSCCGDEPFDSRSSMCCNGGVAPLHGNRGTGCCSRGVSYSFDSSVCCRGTVAPLRGRWHTRCCGNASYDAQTSACCSGGEVKAKC